MTSNQGPTCDVFIRAFDPVRVDEPEAAGGANTGPRPTEYLLAAYVGCTSVIAHAVARDLGITYETLEAEAAGELDLAGIAGVEGVKPDFEWVDAVVRIRTAAPPEDIERLRAGVAQRCPIRNTIEKAGAQLTEKWEAVD